MFSSPQASSLSQHRHLDQPIDNNNNNTNDNNFSQLNHIDRQQNHLYYYNQRHSLHQPTILEPQINQTFSGQPSVFPLTSHDEQPANLHQFLAAPQYSVAQFDQNQPTDLIDVNHVNGSAFSGVNQFASLIQHQANQNIVSFASVPCFNHNSQHLSLRENIVTSRPSDDYHQLCESMQQQLLGTTQIDQLTSTQPTGSNNDVRIPPRSDNSDFIEAPAASRCVFSGSGNNYNNNADGNGNNSTSADTSQQQQPAKANNSNKSNGNRKNIKSKDKTTPQKNFACPICSKEFTEKFNTKRHMQIHSQSRPKYICNECSKSFAWKDNFIRHKKAAHGLSPQ